MLYSYTCENCDHSFDRVLPVSERDEPLKEGCPICETASLIRPIHAPNLVSSYDSVIGKCDSGWNDTLKRIKRASGKSSTIQIK